MSALGIIGSFVLWMVLVWIAWCIVRINHPRTPEEEKEAFDQDCKDFNEFMKGKKK